MDRKYTVSLCRDKYRTSQYCLWKSENAIDSILYTYTNTTLHSIITCRVHLLKSIFHEVNIQFVS